MGSWANDDGLGVKFGTTRSAVNNTGIVNGSLVKTLVVNVDWEDITAAASHIANVSVNDAYLPAYSTIMSAHFTVSEAFTGASSTLGIGLCRADASTVIDADGIDAAIALTVIDAIGDIVVCDGALVKYDDANADNVVSIGANNGFVYFTVGTAALTAGTGRLVIEYLEDGVTATPGTP